MTIKEKRIAIMEYCGANSCDERCVLRIDNYWEHEHPEGCLAFFSGSDKEIEEAYEMITSGKQPEPAANPVPESTTIKDSGDRTAFDSGAVRDMHEGKGRCDLMPLDVAAGILGEGIPDAILSALYSFTKTGRVSFLFDSFEFFRNMLGNEVETLLLEVAKHFEEGAKKYGENNWQKGIPVRSYIDSAVRHYLKCLRGDEDERHDRAFCWNIMCAIWTCEHMPELNNYCRKEDTAK